MYCWVYVDFYQNDGDVFMTAPEVFHTKKAAMKAYEARVKKVFEEEINDSDTITNRIEKPGYLHMCVNYESYYTIYVKKRKVKE